MSITLRNSTAMLRVSFGRQIQALEELDRTSSTWTAIGDPAIGLAGQTLAGLRIFAMRHTLERRLTRDALIVELAQRQPGTGVLHHSDRGSQYACGEYRAQLDAHGFVCSMSKPGDCWDNAVAESFFATLKTELVAEGLASNILTAENTAPVV